MALARITGPGAADTTMAEEGGASTAASGHEARLDAYKGADVVNRTPLL